MLITHLVQSKRNCVFGMDSVLLRKIHSKILL